MAVVNHTVFLFLLIKWDKLSPVFFFENQMRWAGDRLLQLDMSIYLSFIPNIVDISALFILCCLFMCITYSISPGFLNLFT